MITNSYLPLCIYLDLKLIIFLRKFYSEFGQMHDSSFILSRL